MVVCIWNHKQVVLVLVLVHVMLGSDGYTGAGAMDTHEVLVLVAML